MKKTLALIFGCLFTWFSVNCNADNTTITPPINTTINTTTPINTTIAGNGVNQTVTRTISSFSALNLDGAYHTIVTVGQPQKILLSGDANVVTHLVTEVNNDTLAIHQPSGFNLVPTKPITITISIPSLNSLAVAGENIISIAQLKGTDFAINARGRNQITLTGAIDTLALDLRGNTLLDSKKLQAKKVTLNAHGKAQIEVTATEVMQTSSRGNVMVQVYGNPKIVSTSMTGSGNVNLNH